MTNVIVVVVTLVVGGVVMYWLQEWAEKLNCQVLMSIAQPATMKIVEVAVISPKSMMGRDDERVSTAVGFAVQLPLRPLFMVRTPWIVEASHMMNLHKGAVLPVKFDTRASTVIFPNVAWAAYDWRRKSQVLPMPEKEMA